MPRTWTLTVTADEQDDYDNVQDRMWNFQRSIENLLDTGGRSHLEWHTDGPSVVGEAEEAWRRYLGEDDPARNVVNEVPVTLSLCGRCGHSEPHDYGQTIGYCRSYGCLCNRRDIEASIDAMQRPVGERRAEQAREARAAARSALQERENRLAAQRLEMLAEPEEQVCEECRHYPHSSGMCPMCGFRCMRDATEPDAVPDEVRAVAPVQSAEDIEAWIASL